MDFMKLYQTKTTSPDGAVALIKDHETVLVPMAVGQPITLLNALAKRAGELDATLFSVLDLLPTDILKITRNDKLKVDTGYPGPGFRAKVQSGDFTYTPIRILDDRCWEEVRPMDTVMCVCSPMDKNGYFTMGPTLDYSYEAMRRAGKIIIEVNEHMPKSHGVGFLHISEVTALVETNIPLVSLPIAPIDDTSAKIGKYVVDMVEDGSTLQIGIGSIGDSVAASLDTKNDLGVHSELITDGIRALWEKGVITNKRKNFMKYITVGSFAFGSQQLYDWIDNNPSIQFFRRVG